jgi:hypothetical protein
MRSLRASLCRLNSEYSGRWNDLRKVGSLVSRANFEWPFSGPEFSKTPFVWCMTDCTPDSDDSAINEGMPFLDVSAKTNIHFQENFWLY